MKFLSRAFAGLLTLAVCVSLIGYGGMTLYQSITDKSSGFQRPTRERVYSVETDILRPETVAPTIVAHGQIRAWRSLEIRAAAAGPITELAEDMRDGALVAKNHGLFVIDPTEARRKVAEAEIALEDARNQVADATQALSLQGAEIHALEQQLTIRRGELDRQKQLIARKIASQAALDTATGALTAAEQAITAKRQSELATRTRLASAKLSVRRAELTLADARKDLADRSFVAPFAGVLDQVNITLGRRVSQNEQLGRLIDPAALEVEFKIRDAEFGRLLGAEGEPRLQALKVNIHLDLGDRIETVAGTIDRGAAVNEVEAGGRTIYARLKVTDATVMRPGDFVQVEVEERPLEGIAVIPASAATVDGRILLVNEALRIEEVKTTILRRQGDRLLVGDVPFGRPYVKTRLPQLAPGIKVQPRGPEADAPRGNASTETGDGLVALDDARRAKLIDAVKNNKRIPEHRRKTILETLAKPKVPADLVERIESRMGGSRS